QLSQSTLVEFPGQWDTQSSPSEHRQLLLCLRELVLLVIQGLVLLHIHKFHDLPSLHSLLVFLVYQVFPAVQLPQGIQVNRFSQSNHVDLVGLDLHVLLMVLQILVLLGIQVRHLDQQGPAVLGIQPLPCLLVILGILFLPCLQVVPTLPFVPVVLGILTVPVYLYLLSPHVLPGFLCPPLLLLVVPSHRSLP
ncbi:hypothetical protein GBAR_LOCUS15714, partial [Geodia barretti]